MTIAWPPLDDSATADLFLIGGSAAIANVRTVIRQVAPTAASVLVTGPLVWGKEMVARANRVESARAGRPFVAVNYGAILRDLLESAPNACRCGLPAQEQVSAALSDFVAG